MVDASIITRGAEQAQRQQERNWELAGNLAQMVGLGAINQRTSQMRQLPENERQNFASNSIFAPYLNDTLKADQLAASQAVLEQQQAQSKIAQANASAFKDMQQGQGYGFDNSQKLLSAANQALTVAAQSGNPNAARMALSNAYKAGSITPELYDQYSQQINELEMNPNGIKDFAQGLVLANSKDPSGILFQTANNIADNATSIRNNQNTVNATLSGQQVQKDIAQAKLDQDKILSEQEFAFRNGEIKEIITGNDGKAYILYKNGNVEPSMLPSGQQFTPQAKNSTATTQAEERQRIARVGAVLDEIEGILPKSTNSYVGRGLDYIVRGFGGATNGDIAAGELGTLGGQLVALMPKMSGPQSDKDVAMYKQMAGKLDDATTPREVRQAALETIRRLNNKYSEMGNQQQEKETSYRNAGTPFLNAGQQQTENLSKSDQYKLNSILLGR